MGQFHLEYSVSCPNKRDIHVKADLDLTNASDKPIDSLHFYGSDGWDTKLNIPNGTVVYKDTTYLFKIYKLSPPLLPGEKITMTVNNKYITKGFNNNRGNTMIVK